jgi:hypothetical protein
VGRGTWAFGSLELDQTNPVGKADGLAGGGGRIEVSAKAKPVKPRQPKGISTHNTETHHCGKELSEAPQHSG